MFTWCSDGCNSCLKCERHEAQHAENDESGEETSEAVCTRENYSVPEKEKETNKYINKYK